MYNGFQYIPHNVIFLMKFISSDRSSYSDIVLVGIHHPVFEILSISAHISSFSFLRIECRLIIIDPGHLFLFFLSPFLYLSMNLWYLWYLFYDSVCLLLVSFCRSVPPEFLRSFFICFVILVYPPVPSQIVWICMYARCMYNWSQYILHGLMPQYPLPDVLNELPCQGSCNINVYITHFKSVSEFPLSWDILIPCQGACSNEREETHCLVSEEDEKH